ncbi:2-methoxy-6-polyprenyl-1,4-benzoquinol methylase, mitochondrial [Sporomusa rhizae]|uniref:class I SAM-dependent methyltransferase n=1 Tax=Sporomusa rhizae TaxID=357999 RepID=UPI00352A0B9A
MIDERVFFDMLASSWDTTRLADARKISELVALAGLGQGEKVLDAGSGTGILLPFIKKAIGSAGSITAVDFSANMLDKAKEKYDSLGNINFIVADIMEFVPEGAMDAVICFNFFPHIKDKQQFLNLVHNYLQVGGMLVIMHDISRQQVNAIHQGSQVVKDDRLVSGETLRKWLIVAGYQVTEVLDADDRYFIKAVKAG